MDNVMTIRKAHAYFIKQIENNFRVSLLLQNMNDAISTGKIPEKLDRSSSSQ